LKTLKLVIFFVFAGAFTAALNVSTVAGFFQKLSNDSDIPQFTAPEDGSRYSAGSHPPAIVWSGIDESIQYELQFSLDSAFSTAFSMYCDEAFLDLSDLIDQQTWDALSLRLYLRVRVWFADDISSKWSDSLDFSKTVASAPVIVSPGNDARFLPAEPMPVFEWYSLTPVYRFAIEFSGDPYFEDSLGVYELEDIILDFNLAGDQAVWDSMIGTWYWRVWGLENGWIPTPATPAYSFSKTVCEPPKLVSPPNATHYPDISQMPVFEWEPLPHSPDEYHIQFVYSDHTFPAGDVYIESAVPWFSFESVGITEELWNSFYGKLSWRIAGLDSYGNHGGFSEVFWFNKISSLNYMAYGDSVTGGWGSSDFETGFGGYPRQLRDMLRARYSDSIQVFCEKNRSWFSGSHAYTGSANIAAAMEHFGPQHVTIMLGIVDIVDPGAPGCDNFDCRTIEHLTFIIDTIREYGGFPYLASLPPINPDAPRAFLQYAVDELNVDIRNLAHTKNVPLADLDQAFLDAPLPLPDYYSYDMYNDIPDWAHFNDSGYLLIAEVWNQLL
jgi:lysophospholipase L1-like esterase